ncbi:MAG: neutral zinc metallopeptidase [Proteobacteria bacterium]|nr:neutral zinc metallopeptidase [Pseudomonadota bacterium]
MHTTHIINKNGFSILKLLGVIFLIVIVLSVGLLLLDDDETCGPNGCSAEYESWGNDDWGNDSWFTDDEEYSEDDGYWRDEQNKRKSKGKKEKRKYKIDPKSGFESENELEQFVKVVMDSTNEVWTRIFNEYGKKYKKPKLVLFKDQVETECGDADYDDGPFYCYLDQTVYLDLDFFVNMTDEVGAGGDFAYAYVIAHEVGHHVQYSLGDLEKYNNLEEKLRNRGKDSKANLVSVQTELQADFYAGVWAHHEDKKYNSISEKDIEQAFEAAVAVGDDMLGEDSRENFDHGSAEMRLVWLYNGMISGDVRKGNTFKYKSLNQLENAMFEDEEEAEDNRSFREKKMNNR